jgi:hypothetical protein
VTSHEELGAVKWSVGAFLRSQLTRGEDIAQSGGTQWGITISSS